MKIAILGTKGVPNNYGGFEQFAELLSVHLVKNGHEVTVYNPSFHQFKELYYKGVRIIRVSNFEKYIGSAANFFYDHFCLKDALGRDFDIIYEAGYHSVALSYYILKVDKIVKPIVITNMDGLEWKRSKWNALTRKFIKILELIAVNHSPFLISDNIGIQSYYREKFNRDSYFIPYGADFVAEFDQGIIEKYNLVPMGYCLIIARLEPENNIEIILDAYNLAGIKLPIIIIGNCETKYGRYLKSNYSDSHFRFIGGIYDKRSLDAIRNFSFVYFHGHSVGGTNPSLLESMACSCFIAAHRNPFNVSILGEDALYFSTEVELSEVISRIGSLRDLYFTGFAANNKEKILSLYNWEAITHKHELLFEELRNIRDHQQLSI
jgi:hypothetical protein